METDKLIKSNYCNMIKRSFKKEFKCFIYYSKKNGLEMGNDNLDKFFYYLGSENHLIYVKEYLNLFTKKSNFFDEHIGMIMKDYDKYETGVYKINNKMYFRIYEEFFTRNLNFSEYKDFLIRNNFCKYCNISQSSITKLIENEIFQTKRFVNGRGWKLEVDKIDPNGEYNKNNIVACCYWCNNAKTDEFNEVEFNPIGNIIKEIWNNRIENYNNNLEHGEEKLDKID